MKMFGMANGGADPAAVLDLRPLLQQGLDPRPVVLERAGRIAQGDRMVLEAPFDPAPLRALLTEMGFSSRAERVAEDHWRVTLVRDAQRRLESSAGAAASRMAAESCGRINRPNTPPDMMANARDYLIPASIPFRFFAGALAFHVAGWALLLVSSDQLPGFVGGLGPILAALHSITLGVLAMTAIGASFQMLPVATMRPVRSAPASRLTFWLFLPGLALLLYGFGSGRLLPMEVGGALTVAGLALFAWLVIDLVRHAGNLHAVAIHVWIAMTSLVVLALLGLMMIADFSFGYLPDHRLLAIIHGVVAGYGFMGMLVLGFSFILVPMLALAPAGNATNGRRSAILAALALGTAVTGLALANTTVIIIAGLVGLIAAGLHLLTMSQVLRGRMKKRLGNAFQLIRLGWVMLPTSIVVGLAAATSYADWCAPLFGFVLVFGWLLSFLTGILQRIIPFLASMHSSAGGIKPMLVSRLTPEAPLRLHLTGHSLGVVSVAAGIVSGNTPLIRLGASSGLIGAAAFAWFGVVVWRRLSLHLQSKS